MPANVPTYLEIAGIFWIYLEWVRIFQISYKIPSIFPNISNISELSQTSSDFFGIALVYTNFPQHCQICR